MKIRPLYWAMLILIVGLCFIWYLTTGSWNRLDYYAEHHLSLTSYLYFIASNLSLFGQEAIIFTGLNAQSGQLFLTHDYWSSAEPHPHQFMLIPQAWTLSVEICYYLIAPLLCKLKTRTLLIIVASSLALRFFCYSQYGLEIDPWIYRFLPFEIALFLSGGIAYRLYKKYMANRWAKKNPRSLNLTAWIITILFMGVIVIHQFIPTLNDLRLWYPSLESLSSVTQLISDKSFKAFSTYTLAFIAIPFIFYLTQRISWDRKIGEYSYPIYIAHFFIIDAYEPLINQSKIRPYMGLIVLILTILLSYLLIKFISDPIERYRQNRVKKHLGKQSPAPVSAQV